jgi:hypothetical protein
MTIQEDKRAKEFLSCLGNGKGRVTDEDENPEDYEIKEQKEQIEPLAKEIAKMLRNYNNLSYNVQENLISLIMIGYIEITEGTK